MLHRFRILLLAALALSAFAVAGCGASDELVHEGENEGAYLDVGGLRYQVQISRQLNQFDREDRAYLQDVPRALGTLRPKLDTWFGVFMRVSFPQNDAKNEGPGARPVARKFFITDTQRNVYRPVPLGPQNIFAYRSLAVSLRDGQVLPNPGTIAGQGVIGGQLILFKLTFPGLANRPLTLHIESPTGGHEATVPLDI